MALDTKEFIRVRAYHLWEANGRPEGRDLEFWAQAQQLQTATEHGLEPARKRNRAAARTKSAATRQRKRRTS